MHIKKKSNSGGEGLCPGPLSGAGRWPHSPSLCVGLRPFYEDSGRVGLGPTLMTAL